MKRFVFPKEKRGEERRRRKNLSRKKTIDFFLVRQKVKERDEIVNGGPETVTVWDDSRSDRRSIRVCQAKTFDLFLLSATWTERIITLNSNFHVPFALHGLSERRGEGAGRRAVYSRRDSNPLPTVCLLSTKNNQREFYRDCFHDCLEFSLFLHVKSYRVNGLTASFLNLFAHFRVKPIISRVHLPSPPFPCPVRDNFMRKIAPSSSCKLIRIMREGNDFSLSLSLSGVFLSSLRPYPPQMSKVS